MARLKLSQDARAVIRAIENASQATRLTSERVEHELETHTQHDDERFVALTALVTSIATDVKSLLDSRAYGRGFWKAVMLVGGGAGTIAGLAVAALALWK